MKYIENINPWEFFQKMIHEIFNSTFKRYNSNVWFFVAWKKVLKNVTKIDVCLNKLNALIGGDDIYNKAKEFIKKYSEIVSTIPFLIAVRRKKIIKDLLEEILVKGL